MKKQLMAGMMAASMALSLAACGGSLTQHPPGPSLSQPRSFHFQR